MITEVYQPQIIEQETQEYWEREQIFKVTEDLSKEKFYCLSMFPYPSGTLHMGHVRNYTLGDVISRLQKMAGKNVLQPIGWDAFGLPAENAALKNGIHPAIWTKQNIAHMKQQFKRLGFAYDWKREIMTCDPNYYRWEQWFFIKLYEKGLVYKKNALLNWDPVDQTVLANEQVVNGRGWRSGALVERREISQWFLKITHYAEELLKDLDTLTEWPEQVREMQKNWIGRSEGIEIFFDIQNGHQVDRLKIFTTRPDTLMGCTYVAIAAEHPLAREAAKTSPEIAAFIETCSHLKVAEAEMAQIEKKGIATPFAAIHPISGEKLPLWIANFVLMEYGSGAVMAVPAHDERDWEFATHYQLAIKPVIEVTGKAWDYHKGAMTEQGMLVNSGEFEGLTSVQAFQVVAETLAARKQGNKKVHYRLRDWGVSRQRYWGTPIPMILCETCGAEPVPEKDLPVILPEDLPFTGPSSPLKTHPEFYEAICPKCGADARRETDTFDTFVESSWYYARFACPNQDNVMLDDRAKYWTPVDYYIGGIEHAVMHLLYARFFHKLLRDEGLLNSDEPFIHLLTQGMVLKDGTKMSKSKGNVVDPQALVDKYGADTIRFFIIFAAPPEQSLEWSDSGVEGSARFLKRVWQFAQQWQPTIITVNDYGAEILASELNWEIAPENIKLARRELYQILQQALYDYERSQFNTVASATMKIFNILSKIPKVEKACFAVDDYTRHFIEEGFSILLRLLTPITPHLCHYLWRELHYGKNISYASLPKVNKEALKTQSSKYIVQINGKLRGSINLGAEIDEKTVLESVYQDPELHRYLTNKTIMKSIIVPNRKLINLVVGE